MASLPQNLCVPPGTSIRLTLEAITKNGRQAVLQLEQTGFVHIDGE